MSKRQLLIILGVWVMILFYAGFPPAIRGVLAIITGLTIIIVAYSMHSGSASDQLDEAKPYVEHKAPQEAEVSPVPQSDPVVAPVPEQTSITNESTVSTDGAAR